MRQEACQRRPPAPPLFPGRQTLYDAWDGCKRSEHCPTLKATLLKQRGKVKSKHKSSLARPHTLTTAQFSTLPNSPFTRSTCKSQSKLCDCTSLGT